jgi:hypothetical protein
MVTQNRIRACGPASKYTPTIRLAFVRRKEDYGMLWPGAIYDGRAARKMYTEKVMATANRLSAKLILRSEPLYSLAETQSWIAEAETQNAK